MARGRRACEGSSSGAPAKRHVAQTPPANRAAIPDLRCPRQLCTQLGLHPSNASRAVWGHQLRTRRAQRACERRPWPNRQRRRLWRQGPPETASWQSGVFLCKPDSPWRGALGSARRGSAHTGPLRGRKWIERIAKRRLMWPEASGAGARAAAAAAAAVHRTRGATAQPRCGGKQRPALAPALRGFRKLSRVAL